MMFVITSSTAEMSLVAVVAVVLEVEKNVTVSTTWPPTVGPGDDAFTITDDGQFGVPVVGGTAALKVEQAAVPFEPTPLVVRLTVYVFGRVFAVVLKMVGTNRICRSPPHHCLPSAMLPGPGVAPATAQPRENIEASVEFARWPARLLKMRTKSGLLNVSCWLVAAIALWPPGR
jgi:hypothetical protein